MPKQAVQATWNPERDLWETDETDLFSGLSDVYWETLPRSGMTRNGRLFLRPQSEPPTAESECSLSRGLLPTPRSSDSTGGIEDRKARGYGDQLNDIPFLLPTPTSNLGDSGPDYARAGRAGSGGNDLCTTVHLLPTPCASPSGNTPEEHLRKKPGRDRVTDLSILVENDLLETGGKLLPTPTSSDSDASGGVVGTANVTLTDAATRGESRGINFGQYAPAVERWAAALGRESPAPTELSPKGKDRLAPAFVEFMMGLTPGWVTDPELKLSRVQQLRILGNGVVRQQASFALSWLVRRAGLIVSKESHHG